MRVLLSIFLTLSLASFTAVWAQTVSAPPIKYLSSCEIDLNGDGESDIAVLADTNRGRELIALVNSAGTYKAYVVSRGKPHSILTCRYGRSVTETKAAGGKARTFKTPGTYLVLTQPESSSVAFFWANDKFQEVWISD